jgi:ATPase family associated with various cellular activities (AAA)
VNRLEAHREVLRLAVGAYLEALGAHWAPAPGGAEPSQAQRASASIGTVANAGASAERVRAVLRAAEPGALGAISEALELSTGEEVLVAAAWWVQADPQVAFALGCAHDDAARRFATAALLRALLRPFEVTVPAAVPDDGRLTRGGVLQPGAGGNEALTLTATAAQVLAGEPPPPVSASEPAPSRLDDARAGLVRHLQGEDPGPVVLRGPHGVGRHALASAAATEVGRVPIDGTRPSAELALLSRLGIALPIVDADQLTDTAWNGAPAVGIAEPGATTAGAHVVDLPGPDFHQRATAWEHGLRGLDAPDDLVGALSARFAFTEGDIAEVLRRTRRDARWAGRPLDGALVWEAARRQPEHALSRLAALVTPAFGLDDLVVEPDCRSKLDELVAHVELQHVVLDAWGFRRRLPRGQGVIALFAGPSGTGKTMAAEAVAAALRQDLYRVDLSAVVSKYIGETEKNLATAFDEAQRAGAVLFFDEADALFGKRTEVKDAHDRYANLEINYLLQRVETFTGLVILATNRRSALDEAFLRRLRFAIRFELPGPAARAEIWRRAFPAGAPRDELDWDGLAAVELSGGSIQGTALAAAYLAAAAGEPVTDGGVEHALRRELEKLGRAWPGPPNGKGVPT